MNALESRQAQTVHESVLPTFKTYYGAWTTRPSVAMGLVPHGPRLPEHEAILATYTGDIYENWTKVIPWAVVFPDGISPHPQNSRVAVKDFGLAYWHKAQNEWITVSRVATPVGGQYHNLQDFGDRSPYEVFFENETACYSPPAGKACELWTTQELFDYDQIGGICSWITHKHVSISNAGDSERWLIQIAADYWPGDGYPDVGVVPIPGVGTGRIQRVMPCWRTATFFLSDGSFDINGNMPPI